MSMDSAGIPTRISVGAERYAHSNLTSRSTSARNHKNSYLCTTVPDWGGKEGDAKWAAATAVASG